MRIICFCLRSLRIEDGIHEDRNNIRRSCYQYEGKCEREGRERFPAFILSGN